MVHCISSFEVTTYEKYKIQLVNQFLSFSPSVFTKTYYFLQLLRTKSNIFRKKIFTTNCHFLTDSPKPPKPFNSQNLLSVSKVFCWGSLNLKNLWFYIWVAVAWLFHFTKQMTLRHLLSYSWPWAWIKNLNAKTTKYILKCWERSVERKSNLSFIRVIKIYLLINVFYMYMVR